MWYIKILGQLLILVGICFSIYSVLLGLSEKEITSAGALSISIALLLIGTIFNQINNGNSNKKESSMSE